MLRNAKLAIASLVLVVSSMSAQTSRHHKPLPGSAAPSRSSSQLRDLAHPNIGVLNSRWSPVKNLAPVVRGATNPMLLTDGTVLVHDLGFEEWWKLTPDQNGSYINGTWSRTALLPKGYIPIYFSSAVLPDGRLIVEGGQYLGNPGGAGFSLANSPLGAIYNPVADSWTPVAPPAGWQTIGAAPNAVLANGTYMQANCCTTEQALLNPRTLTWTTTGANKFDTNEQEGWTLLPNGKVLTVDAYAAYYTPDGANSELYSPHARTWQSAGSTVAQLWDSAVTCGGESAATSDVGPGVLRPDGTVFYVGANSCGAGNTAIYDSKSGTWTAGPQLPGNLNVANGPAALEPNGNVLFMASAGVFYGPAQFFEWDGQSLNPVAGFPNAATDPSYQGNMLVLPTGQILLTDSSDQVQIYTPKSVTNPQWAPQILQSPFLLSPGGSYQIAGLRFNGVSQGAAYGDNAQSASNYPLVRITNWATGHVFYSRTHDHSSMAVASNDMVLTHFDVPQSQELGLSKIEIVANGVASYPVFALVY